MANNCPPRSGSSLTSESDLDTRIFPHMRSSMFDQGTLPPVILVISQRI